MLDEIIRHKRQEVAARKAVRPQGFFGTLPKSDRSLAAALVGKSPRFIFECKKASPSKGLIRPNFDLDEICKAYSPMADAISVLTDEQYFQGSFEYLKKVKSLVKCPVLCKDFVLEPYQVYEARYHGADAILVMLSVLSDEEAKPILAACGELEMDALVEVHDETELKRALDLNAQIIGINNRNLGDLSIDLQTTKNLSPKVPRDKIVICESGMETHSQIQEFSPLSNAFLVGSSVMAKSRIDLACRELKYGAIKICGLTRVEDAIMAYEAGASLGGLIFAAESPRAIDLDTARKIVASAPLNWVGVFVNESIEKVVSTAEALNLFAVQLHGDETKEYLQDLQKILPGETQIWKSFSVKESLPDEAMYSGSDYILLDTHSDHQRGGSGKVFDWKIFDKWPHKARTILGGGLSPNNIGEAAKLGFAILDVNSGVEESPGKKSHLKVSALFSELAGKSRLGVESEK